MATFSSQVPLNSSFLKVFRTTQNSGLNANNFKLEVFKTEDLNGLPVTQQVFDGKGDGSSTTINKLEGGAESATAIIAQVATNNAADGNTITITDFSGTAHVFTCKTSGIDINQGHVDITGSKATNNNDFATALAQAINHNSNFNASASTNTVNVSMAHKGTQGDGKTVVASPTNILENSPVFGSGSNNDKPSIGAVSGVDNMFEVQLKPSAMAAGTTYFWQIVTNHAEAPEVISIPGAIYAPDAEQLSGAEFGKTNDGANTASTSAGTMMAKLNKILTDQASSGISVSDIWDADIDAGTSGVQAAKSFLLSIGTSADAASAASVFGKIAQLKASIDLIGDENDAANVASLFGRLKENQTDLNSILSDTGANKATLEHSQHGLANLKNLIDAIPTTNAGTNNAALASVLGALNDAVATTATGNNDTVMSLVKGIIGQTKVMSDDLANGGRLDLLIDAIKTKTDGLAANTSAVLSTIDSEIGVIDGLVDNIKAKTDNLPADTGAVLGSPAGASLAADIAAVKSDTAAILTDTSTTLNNFVDGIESTLGAPAGASVSADIAAVKTVADGINSTIGSATAGASTDYDTDKPLMAMIRKLGADITTANSDMANTTDGFGAIKADTAAAKTASETNQTTLGNAAHGLAALKSLIDTVKVDTAANQVDVDAVIAQQGNSGQDANAAGTVHQKLSFLAGKMDDLLVNSGIVANVPSQVYANISGSSSIRIGAYPIDGATGTLEVTSLLGAVPLQAEGRVTITDNNNIAAGDSIAFQNSANETITATAHASTTTSTDTDNPTFAIGANANATAANLATCLDANAALTASADNNEVKITQATAGAAGNKTITLTDAGAAGMSKNDISGGQDGSTRSQMYIKALKNNGSDNAYNRLYYDSSLSTAGLQSAGNGANSNLNQPNNATGQAPSETVDGQQAWIAMAKDGVSSYTAGSSLSGTQSDAKAFYMYYKLKSTDVGFVSFTFHVKDSDPDTTTNRTIETQKTMQVVSSYNLRPGGFVF